MSFENLNFSPSSFVGSLGSVRSLGSGSTVGSLLAAVSTDTFLVAAVSTEGSLGSGSVGSLLAAVSTEGSLGSGSTVGSLLAAVSTVGSLGSGSTVGSLLATVSTDTGSLKLTVGTDIMGSTVALLETFIASVLACVSWGAIALGAGGVDTFADGTDALDVTLVLSINTVKASKTGVGGTEVTETILTSDSTEIATALGLGAIEHVDSTGNGLSLDDFVLRVGTLVATVATEASLEA